MEMIRNRPFYNCNELPHSLIYYEGAKQEIFSGSWVNVFTMNNDGYSCKKGEPQVSDSNSRVMVENTFKDLTAINIFDLPFCNNSIVTLYDWNEKHLVLEYLNNYYKISNFTEQRGTFEVSIRRTTFKGFLKIIKSQSRPLKV